MQQHIRLIIAVLMVSTAIFSCKSSKHSKIKRLPGVWQEQPITIDGSNKDWPSPYPEYDDKAQLGYAVSNDKENLYITVETGDAATQLKILREGLTIWIDKTGSKEEETAINFPIPSASKEEPKQQRHHTDKPASGQFQDGQGGGSAQDKQRMDLEDRVRRAMDDANEYSLQGFKSCNLQYPIMENDSCGIKVRIGLDTDNELVWEAVVPFKTFYTKREITRADKGKPMSICFETVAMKRPSGDGSGNRSGGSGMRPSVGIGGMGMGMGGMRMGSGGGHGGNHGAQQPSIMEPAYKSSITWKKFGIAFQ